MPPRVHDKPALELESMRRIPEFTQRLFSCFEENKK
jgi:hypothetical protein